jgi:rhomboid protease GluP
MANIRGFGDIRNEGNPGNPRGFGGPPGGNDPEPSNSQGIFRLLGMGDRNQKNPRDETFFDMLHYNFCPTLRFKSLTGMLTPILVGLFILSLILSGVNTQGEFLEVGGGSFFQAISQNGYKIRIEHQYQRLITSMFFHLTFMHIIMNCISMLIWGSFIESFVGTPKFAIIFFVSGLTGNLMSVVCHKGLYYNSVGASGCLMGITAALVGMLILNWLALGEGQFREARSTLTCIVIIITIFALLFTFQPSSTTANPNITTDHWAHLGGLLGGFTLSMAIGKVFGRNDTTYEKRVRIVGWVLFAGLVLGTAIPLFAITPSDK